MLLTRWLWGAHVYLGMVPYYQLEHLPISCDHQPHLPCLSVLVILLPIGLAR